MASNSRDRDHTTVIIHLHVAALLLGGTALFSKVIPFPAIDIIAYRTLICGLVIIAIGKAVKEKLWISHPKHLALVVLASALFCVHWTTYFHAMQLSSVAIGIVSMFTFPVITVLIEPLFNKTKLLIEDVVMGICVLAGVFLIIPDYDLSNDVTLGVVFGLVSAVAVAFRGIIIARWLSQYSAFSIMAFHGLISAAILLPVASISISSISVNEWLLLLALGVIFTALPHTQLTYGLTKTSAKSVSMIASLQVVYATLFAYLLLDEHANWQTITGGGLILFAALYESMKKPG